MVTKTRRLADNYTRWATAVGGVGGTTQKELAQKLVLEIGGSGWYSLMADDFFNRPEHGYRGRLANPTLSWYESLNTWTSILQQGRPDAKMSNAQAFKSHLAICEKYADIPPFIAEDPDGHSLMWAIRNVSQTLTERESSVLFLKFGLRDGYTQSFQELGTILNVTRERARQITMKAIRKLRHPTRFQHIRPFLYPYNRDDERAVMARYELHLRLSEVYPMELSFNLVMRLRRRYLADALKAVNSSSFRQLNQLVAYSCSLQMGICQLCGEPALPSSNWCLTHLELKNQIIVICDGCGIKFPRNPSQLTQFSRLHGRTQHAVFHDKKCFHANQVRLKLHGGFKTTDITELKAKIATLEGQVAELESL